MGLVVKIIFLVFTVLLLLYGAGARDDERAYLYTVAALMLAGITVVAVRLI